MNNTTDVVPEHLAQDFVYLARFRFASESFAKFSFDHGERGFDVRSSVVILKELILMKMEEVIHILPNLNLDLYRPTCYSV